MNTPLNFANVDLIPLVSLLIPILGIVMGIGIAMLAIYLSYRKRTEMFALYHQERMAAIDKGIELPPLPEEFFTEDGKPVNRSSSHQHLLSGLILSFIGLSLMAALYFGPHAGYLWALIPTAIGLALLIFYFAIGRKRALEVEAAAKAKLAEAQRPVAS